MVSKQHIGAAGELRVMSELFLRGYNPAKTYIDNGADLILQDGTKIEVKCSTRSNSVRKADGRKRSGVYVFHLGGNKRKLPNREDVDFVICWCIDDDIFYIIPYEDINCMAVSISDIRTTAKTKFAKYINKWELLRSEI